MPNDNHFLHFTKKERTGIIVMISLIVLIITASHLYGNFFRPVIKVEDSVLQKFAKLQAVIDTTSQEKVNESSYTESYKKSETEEKKTSSLFPFDPNTLSQDGWQSLGVKEKTA